MQAPLLGFQQEQDNTLLTERPVSEVPSWLKDERSERYWTRVKGRKRAFLCPRAAHVHKGQGGQSSPLPPWCRRPWSGNPLLIFLQSYHVWVTSKIQVDFRFKTYSEVLVNVSYRFLKFLDYLCFGVNESIADISIELPCLGDLENPGRLSVQHVLGGTGDCVLKFFHYLCFWGQGILCWHSYGATMFGGPQKFRSPSGSRGFQRYPNIRSLTKML